jgi:hypothetical protein
MKHLLAIAVVLACSACSGSNGGSGGGITKEECKLVYEKGFQLQGMPEDIYADTLDMSAQVCADKDAVSREDYECVVRAGSLADYQACEVVFDFR